MFPTARPTNAQQFSHNQSVERSATMKKRSAPLSTITTNTKRSRHAGPFFEESESDTESEDENPSDGESDDKVTSKEPPPRGPVVAHRNTQSDPANLRDRELNIARLRSLLAKTQRRPAPDSQTQRGTVAKQQSLNPSMSKLQQKPFTARIPQQHFSPRPTPAGDAALRSEDVKPRNIVTKSANAPATSWHQMHGPTRLNLVQGNTARLNPGFQIGSQQSNASRSARPPANSVGISQHGISNTAAQGMGNIKIESKDLLQSPISAPTQVNKNTTSAPAVVSHVSTTTRERPLQSPDIGQLQRPSKPMDSSDNRPKTLLGSTANAIHPRRPNVVQNRQNLNTKPVVGPPQPIICTQVRRQIKPGDNVMSGDVKSTLSSRSSVCASVKTVKAPPQATKEKGPVRASGSQKAPQGASFAVIKKISGEARIPTPTPSSPVVHSSKYHSSTQNTHDVPLQDASEKTATKYLITHTKSLGATSSQAPSASARIPMSTSNQFKLVIDRQVQDTSSHSNESDSDIILPIFSGISESAEPYFEYSVFQRIWGDRQREIDTPATEMTTQPFTNIHVANTHAQKLFGNTTELYTKHIPYKSMETASRRDKYDCETHIGTFASIDNPGRTIHVKFWVQRDRVSVFANQEPAEMKLTPFILKKVFVLRLFKSASILDETSTRDSHNEPTQTRIYHPHQRTEVYTTLESANRAARNVQIELSYNTNPTNEVSMDTRELAIRELNASLSVLDESMGGNGGFWNSKFHGVDRSVDMYELIAEEVGLCGPRNL